GYTQLTASNTGAITSGMTGTAQQTNNIQYDATANGTSPLITANTTINTLYMTSGSTPIPSTNIPSQTASFAQNGFTRVFYNGIRWKHALGLGLVGHGRSDVLQASGEALEQQQYRVYDRHGDDRSARRQRERHEFTRVAE